MVGVHVSPTVFFNVRGITPWEDGFKVLTSNVGCGRAEHQQQLHGSPMGRVARPERGLMISRMPVNASMMSCISFSSFFFLVLVCAYMEPEPSRSEERWRGKQIMSHSRTSITKLLSTLVNIMTMHVHLIKRNNKPDHSCVSRREGGGEGEGVDFQTQHHQFVTRLLTQWRLVVERTPK